ncbi:hypothetical protein ACTQWG_09290 [Blautia sp. HCP3S3_H10_1]|uniref:hypothetical protein n=1 Tax=unclassified Blautia TaxID=2648079 RepID=UPI003F8DDCA5
MKKKKNVMYRKSVSLLAAAAMTAVLMTGQAYPVIAWGQNTETRLETSSLIPDNITIEQPVALSEVTLPKSDYGILSWVDTSFVPDKRVQSCEVVFKPAADVDLSYLPGWDAEQKVVKGKITVVVNSIEADRETDSSQLESAESSGTGAKKQDDALQGESADTGKLENTPDAGEAKDDIESENKAGENTSAAGNSAENSSEAPSGANETSKDGATGSAEEVSGENTGASESTGSDGTQDSQLENGSALAEPDGKTDDGKAAESVGAEITDSSENTDSNGDVNSSEAVDNGEATDGTNNADNGGNASDSEAVIEETGKLNQTLGIAMPGATVLDGTDKPDEKENIFDNPLDFTVADTRPDVAEDNLTEEEQAARAAQNHSCDGIQVSGIDLPWYVQFQVTSGENYEFRNESKATIFQSYEFKLWDLKNNIEYEIPDGQYVSVTIPVKEGYEYSVEHLLDNGATETIIPSVNGSTLVFSTHSFSPFGIAGFHPVIGDEIANGAYGDGSTPTPTPTVTISGTPTPSPFVTGAGTNGTSGTGTADKSNGTGNTDNSNGTGSGNNAGTSSGGNTAGSTASGNGSSGGAGTSGNEAENSNGTTGTGTSSGTSDNGTGNSGTVTGTDGNGAGNSSSGTAGGQTTAADTSANNGAGQTSNAVKTGDNTMILPFVILVVAAAAVIIIVLVVRRKKDK